MRTGRIEHIHVAPDSGDPMTGVDEIEGVAGRGLRGDRYFEERGIWNHLDRDPERDERGASDVTFIEAESIEAVESQAGTSLEPGAHRRNVTTRDVALNHLVGERFEAGGLVCEGIELCEPCGYMQSLVGEEGLSAALVHRGGLNAHILESGSIAVGDELRW